MEINLGPSIFIVIKNRLSHLAEATRRAGSLAMRSASGLRVGWPFRNRRFPIAADGTKMLQLVWSRTAYGALPGLRDAGLAAGQSVNQSTLPKEERMARSPSQTELLDVLLEAACGDIKLVRQAIRITAMGSNGADFERALSFVHRQVQDRTTEKPRRSEAKVGHSETC